MRAHAHHTYETTVDGDTVSLSVAPFADESEAAWRVADTDPCWEALKAGFPAGVDGGTLKYD